MRIERPEFVPDPSLSREEMETLQREIGSVAVFEDAFGFDAAAVGRTNVTLEGGSVDPPVIAAVDQAFLDDRVVSAVVATRGGEVVERAHAVTGLTIPYIPGLLSFREGESALEALTALEIEPDLLLVDGSGRIHYREAGLATHIGVTLDVPSVGVAKGLLCGTPERSLSDPLPEGERVPILADDDVTAANGTLIGYAVQTRQYEGGSRHINPIYVSGGHRVSAETAAEFAARLATEYKLPEPIREADRYADEVKRTVES